MAPKAKKWENSKEWLVRYMVLSLAAPHFHETRAPCSLLTFHVILDPDNIGA